MLSVTTGFQQQFRDKVLPVVEKVRGLKAGEFLLAAVIQRAMALGADRWGVLRRAGALRARDCQAEGEY